MTTTVDGAAAGAVAAGPGAVAAGPGAVAMTTTVEAPRVRGRKPTLGVGFLPLTSPGAANLIAIAIPAIAGAVVTAIALTSRSLWLDEGSTFTIASQHGHALWHGIANDGGNMLGYYLLMHVLVGWFGHALWLLRLPSVIATAATGGLVAALALRLFSGRRRLAVAAGLLTVVSVPLVFWGQNARGYAILVALSVASFLALTAILQTPPERAPARGAVIAYVLSTLAAMYVGYDVALLIPAQLALLLVYRERARLVIGCLAIVLALSIPLVVLALQRGSGQLFWVTPLSMQIAVQAGLTLLSAGMPPNFHHTSTTVLAALVTGPVLLVALLLATYSAVRDGRRALPVLILLSWFAIPTVLALGAYGAGEPVELARVTILVMPAVALLLAWLLLGPGLAAARGSGVTGVLSPGAAAVLRQVAPTLGVAGVAVLLALRLLQLIPSYGTSPEPWNAATKYVLAATPTSEPACVAFYPSDGREPFDYYLLSRGGGAGASLTPALPALAWSSVRPYVEDYVSVDAGQRASIASACPRLWLISSHAGRAHGGTPQSRANFVRYRTLEKGLLRLYPHTSERDFGWASRVEVRLLYR